MEDPRYGRLIIIIAMMVYGAVILTKVIARVHPVYLMNAD